MRTHPLRGLPPMSAPVDLSSTVPETHPPPLARALLRRKRLSDRLPLEWISLGMLLLLAAIYAVLKLLRRPDTKPTTRHGRRLRRR